MTLRICVHASDKSREHELADAILAGARIHGHDGEVRSLCAEPDISGYDIGVFVGVKSRRLHDAHKAAGVRFLQFDKGYARGRPAGGSGWEYWRVSPNAHQPTEHLLDRKYSSDRFDRLGLTVAPWRLNGLHVIIAGSSEKYHAFYGLGDPNEYARRLVKQIRQYTDRPIIYRPKPSWRGAVEIKGTKFSGPKEPITSVLGYAHCLITHGSNACFEAMLAGIPSIVLGDAVAKPISSTSIADIENLPTGKRERLLNALAYHQFTLAEHRSGEAWNTIGEWI